MWHVFRRLSRKEECSKTKERLSIYIDQRLGAEEVAQVEGHLSSCLGCRRELESLQATVALLHQLPEAIPSRSFAVAPVRSLPGRRALPALRFATAGVVLLLVLAFAADGTNVFEKTDQDGSYYAAAELSGGDRSYWLVPGEMNALDPSSENPVEANLIVPDGTDNVSAAVAAISDEGVVYGTLRCSSDETPQLVVTEGENGAAAAEDAQEFAVVSDVSEDRNKFTTNDGAVPSALGSVIEGQDVPYLNMLSSDNSALYSFNLAKARTETVATRQNAWLRPLEYGLIGLVAVLAGATAALWLRRRRQRAVAGEASRS